MATANHKQYGQSGNKSQVQARPAHTVGSVHIPLTDRRSMQGLTNGNLYDPTGVKNANITINGVEHQLIPVEIEKEAELGLVLGQIKSEQWIFIDEILPNGMIDMHGILKEGDYLTQAGAYSLIGVDIPTALTLVERAYDEGRKGVTFVGARAQKSGAPRDDKRNGTEKQSVAAPPPPPYDDNRKQGRARSFVEYENAEEEEPRSPPPVTHQQRKPRHSKRKNNDEDAKF